ncbi:MAG: ATP-binding protein [Steroidobacteraceae bacterium]
MHRILRRQLRRALKLESIDAVEETLRRWLAEDSDAAKGPDAPQLREILRSLITSVDQSYLQLERDLDLRTRSLDISSAELFEVNTRLKSELDAQRLAADSLLAAAKRLAKNSALPLPTADQAGIRPLTEFLTRLAHDRDSAISAREQSEQRLRMALDASNLSMWDWDFGSTQIFYDRNFARFIGTKEQDATYDLGALSRRTVPADAQALSTAIRDVVLGHRPDFEVELRVRHEQGHWLWLQTFGSVTVRDPDGRARRLTGIVADISKRKQLENEIAANLKLLETVLDTMPLPVLIKDRTGQVQRANSAWDKMVSAGTAGESGHGLAVNSPVLGSVHRKFDLEVIASGQPARYEARIIAPNQREYDVLVAKAPLKLDNGEVTGIISVITDISEQKRTAGELDRARLAAEAAARAKSGFLANMSHELRTPLNGVVGMASLLETTRLDSRQARFVQTLKSSADALIAIINDILDISKIEAGKLDVATELVNVREELEHVVNLFSAQAFAKGIEIASHLAPGAPPTIQSDRLRLRQVLSNLVSNAIKFTERGAVLVSASRGRAAADTDANHIEFAVIDSGIGIAPQLQEHVFEAFAQADDSATRRFGGTGLGLAICQRLVELMGGSLGLDSAPGQGSRFYFTLPATGAESSASWSATDDVAALVVAPEAIIASALAETLASRSALALIASDGIDAVTQIESLPANLRHIQIVIDSGDDRAELESWVSAMRLAAAGRSVTVTLLLPHGCQDLPPIGIDRCIGKPVCTAALFEQGSDTGAAGATTRSRSLIGPVARKRVLIVEDNAVNQELVAAMLETVHMDYCIAVNGREGVELYEKDGNFDLVLMDCQMPVMDGFAASRRIRELEDGTRRVPIIALTGNAMEGDRDSCIAAGMDDYLPKPINLALLRDMLDRWLCPPATQSEPAAGAA